MWEDRPHWRWLWHAKQDDEDSSIVLSSYGRAREDFQAGRWCGQSTFVHTYEAEHVNSYEV